MDYYGFPALREAAFLIPPLLSWRLATLDGALRLLRRHQISPKRILDVGCAAGFFSRKLARTFPNSKILAIDLSESMVRYAKRKAKGLKNLEFGAYDLFDLNETGFDLATAFYLIMVTGVERTVAKLIWTVKIGGFVLLNMTSLTPLTFLHFHFYKFLNGHELELMKPEKFVDIAQKYSEIIELLEVSETEGSYMVLLRRSR